MPQIISTDKAPKAIGPYSQAVIANGLVFVSGQIPIDPSSGQLLTGNITEQTKRVMTNLQSILEAAGSRLSLVLKTTVYLADMDNFEEMNKVYAEYFYGVNPARATVQVARLPKDATIEIDAIASLSQSGD